MGNSEDALSRPGAAMPPRPGMSDSTPAPIRKAPAPVGAVLAARSLWITSIVVTAAAIVFAFLSRAEQLEPFTDVIGTLQPDLDPADREPIAAAIIVGCLAALAVIVIVEGILVRSMVVGARAGARWALVVVVVINGLVCAMASTFITVGQYGVLAAGLLAAELALACAALVAGFLPSATVWFRREHQARRHPADVA